MADFSKRGPGCDDDCDGEGGERGERGKRGKRGHRGHDGRDGRDGEMGATGPTGPGSSGGGPIVTDPTPPTFTGNGTDESPLQVINVAPQPFTSPDENRFIFANAGGSDEEGDGTEGNPYRTLQRAVLDVPLFIPGGVHYYVDVTGLGQEALPDGYELPPWKAPVGYFIDFSDQLFVTKAAVNIVAQPQLASNIPAADAVITDADLVPTDIGGGIANVEADPIEQFIRVTTNVPHGLFNAPFPAQQVTIDGVMGDIGNVVNGDHFVFYESPTSFLIFEDGTGLTYGGGGTVSTLFVQDPVSGQIQVKTTKNFGADDSLVGKLFLSPTSPFEQAVIYANTADTLFITSVFFPSVFPGIEFQIAEQSAELLTTFSGDFDPFNETNRSGFTAANIDSLALNGIKITPTNLDERGLLQYGGTVVCQGCHLTNPKFASAVFQADMTFCFVDAPVHPGSSIDLVNCLYVNYQTEEFKGPVGWMLVTGTVFENCGPLEFDTSVSQNLFGVKFRNAPDYVAIFYLGRNTWNRVSLEDCALGLRADGGASRNRMEAVNGNITPGEPIVECVHGGQFLVSTDPGRVAFSGPTDFMRLDGLPDRTFADFRVGIAGPRGEYTSITRVHPTEGATGTLSSVLEYDPSGTRHDEVAGV